MIINEAYLKKFSPIPLNYNMAEIKNYIDIAEKIWILPLIGYEWYQELEEQVKNNEVSEENATALIEAIWPYLGFAVAYEALPSLMYHVSEISVTKGHSDNSDALDLKELSYYQQHLRNQVEVRKDFCKKWICEHYLYYPLADVCACNCSCCCQNNPKLNDPNPQYQVYKPFKRNTNLL